MKIKSILAREILDSRGEPTVEATIVVDDETLATASTPSGTSTGTHEALELRDNDSGRYLGRGVLEAVRNIKEKIAPSLIGTEVQNQSQIDHTMIQLDASKNKGNLGANAILAVSIAAFKAAAASIKMPAYQYISSKCQVSEKDLKIPIPIFNMLDGGKHGIGYLDFQEFHIIPASSKTYQESLQLGVEIYQTIGRHLKEQGLISSVGFEGGYTPNILNNDSGLNFIRAVSAASPYREKKDFFFGLDVAATSFYKDGVYRLKDFPDPLSTDALIEFYQRLLRKYHFISLEDPLHEDDWEGWFKLTTKIGKNLMIVGDDLLCTSQERLLTAIESHTCNAILVKPNQVGTVSETMGVIKLAKENKMKIIISHRAGETNDDFIADFAVGSGADYVKFGAPARGERVAKYNRLSRIEEELKKPKKPTPKASKSKWSIL